MRISRVKISNFCQHKERDDEFQPGVVGVIGRNGAGKSNYLKAIRKALTGISGNVGKNEEDIAWGENKGSVEVHFESGGEKGMVRRQLKSSSCLMKFGDRKFTTATEIDAAIYDILGLSARVLTEMVFVEQGRIEGILFQRPADRAKALQSLFGTERSQAIRELLGNEINVLDVESFKGVIELTEKRLNDSVVIPLRTSREERDNFKVQLCDDKSLEAAKSLLEKYNAQRLVLSQLEQVQTLSKQHEAALKAASDRASGLQVKAVAMQRAVEAEQGNIAVQRDLVTRFHRQRSVAASRATLKNSLTTQQFVVGMAEPVKPTFTEQDLDEARQLLSSLEAPYRLSLEVVRVSASECPTCHQPISAKHIEDHRCNVEALLPQLAKARADVSKMSEESMRWTKEHMRWQTITKVARDQIVELTKTLSELPQEEVIDEAKVAEALKDIECFDAFIVEFNNLQLAHKEAVAALVNSQAALSNTLQLTEKLQGTFMEFNPADVTAANDLVTSQEKLRVRLADAVNRVAFLEEQEKQLLSQLETYRQREQQSKRVRQWRDLATAARGLLHHNELPNLVAQNYFKTINLKLAYYLELFGAEYTAYLTAENNIECVFPANKAVPAERLSGGQRVILGVSFRFAVYDIFVGDMGLMVLDEPTVFLDDDNIEAVRRLLERVKSYSKAAGLQLIVVTHEKRLSSVFDQVVGL